MTTVLVSKRLGLAMTDSRATATYARNFAGFFPLTPEVRYGVVNQKAIYIHDRLFLGSGDVNTINMIIDMLINSTELVIDKNTPMAETILIGKEYAIHMWVWEGKFHKELIFLTPNWLFTMGSGAPYLDKMHRLKGDYSLFDVDFVIEEFKKVQEKDKYTDDNINLYRI